MAKPLQPVSNAEIAASLREMALFLEMDAVPFKPRAYEKAAQAVEALERPLHRIAASSEKRASMPFPRSARASPSGSWSCCARAASAS